MKFSYFKVLLHLKVLYREHTSRVGPTVSKQITFKTALGYKMGELDPLFDSNFDNFLPK